MYYPYSVHRYFVCVFFVQQIPKNQSTKLVCRYCVVVPSTLSKCCVFSVCTMSQSNLKRTGIRRSDRVEHWREVTRFFDVTKNYNETKKCYPEAFLDGDGNEVSVGCGRIRCVRWSESLALEEGRTDIVFYTNPSKKSKLLRESEGSVESDEAKRQRRESATGGLRPPRMDRVLNWREVAEYFVEVNQLRKVRERYPEAFVDYLGTPVSDNCAKMRVTRWRQERFPDQYPTLKSIQADQINQVQQSIPENKNMEDLYLSLPFTTDVVVPLPLNHQPPQARQPPQQPAMDEYDSDSGDEDPYYTKPIPLNILNVSKHTATTNQVQYQSALV